MKIRTLLLLLPLALPGLAAPEAVISAVPQPAVRSGMKVKILYGETYYQGVLVRIEGGSFVVRDDATGKEYAYAGNRVFDLNDVALADLAGPPQVRAAAIQDRRQGVEFFVALWTTSRPAAWRDRAQKAAGAKTEGESEEVTWLRIQPNATWRHRLFGREVEGAWKSSEDPKRPGIVLVNAGPANDDLYVQRRPKGEIFLQRAGGGAGSVGIIVPPEWPAPDQS